MAALASQQALAVVTDSLVSATSSVDDAALSGLAGDLAAAGRVLASDVSLRRALSDPTLEDEAKHAFVQRLFDGKIGELAMTTVRDAVAQRWGSGRDLADALVTLSRTTRFVMAEKSGNLDAVEEELFRFSRIIDAAPELSLVLDDPRTDPAGRAELVKRLIDGKALPLTSTLLTELAAETVGRGFTRQVEELVKEAAARRDKLVAQVTSAVPLDDGEKSRLAASLESIYARQVTVHVTLDPAMQGGLTVRVGDEVIDGSVSGRLADLRARLARRS